MKHQLNVEDLNTFESKTQIAGAFGNGENKSLNIVSKVLISGKIYSYYTVEVRRAEQIQTTNLEKAVLEYNRY